MSTQTILFGLEQYVAAYKTGDYQTVKANLLSLKPFTMALTILAMQDHLLANGPLKFYEGFRQFLTMWANEEHQ